MNGNCSVLNCKTTRTPRKNVGSHSFPADYDLGIKWRNLCGNPAIASITPAILTRNNVVCSLHFKKKEKKITSRGITLINRRIVPSLRLPPPLSEVLNTNKHMLIPTLDLNKRLSKINLASAFSKSDDTGIEYLPVYLPEENLEVFDEEKMDLEPEPYDTFVIIETGFGNCDDIETTTTSEPPQEICRTCSKACDNTKIEIFSEKGKKLKLKEKIHTHLPIRVHEDDILPLQMCAKCVEQLDAFHSMSLDCFTADTKLRTLFKVQCSDAPHLIKTDRACESSTEDNIYDTLCDNSNRDKDDFLPCNDDIANTSKTEFAIETENEKENIRKEKIQDMPSNTKKIQRSYKRNTLYTCPVCSETVEGKLHFDFHLSKEHGKYQCRICYLLFDNSVCLNSHRLKDHKKECTICDVKFTYRRELYSHMISVHADLKPYQCESCEAEFPLEEMLIKHQQIHKYVKISKIYECVDCREKFDCLTDLKIHMKGHASSVDKKQSFLCDLCGKSYMCNSKLQYHMKIHTNNMDYKCDKCSKKFYYACNLKLHKEVHSGKEFKCSKCPAKYKHRRDLDVHTKYLHIGQWYYQCIVCSIKFNSEQEVDTHFKTHANSKVAFVGSEVFIKVSDFQCSICDRYFLNKSTLHNHKRRAKCRTLGESHYQIKNFMCQTCGKYLATKSSLNNHCLTHMESKLFHCEFCSRGFNWKPNLINHIRTHTGEKPFECDICHKMFMRKQDVSRHKMYIHLNIRNYKCDVCEKAFKTSNQLKVHYRIHTHERPYKCDVCSRTFIQHSDIARHRRITNHHTNTVQHLQLVKT